MNDSNSLIDVETLDFLDDHQTWLYMVPYDSNKHLDIVDWNLSCDWSTYEDNEYTESEKKLYSFLDNILKDETFTLDKHKFDSRTYVRPKKRASRPSIHNIVEAPHLSSTPNSQNKYLTYNKHSLPSPMIRLKTFNVDTNSDNSTAVKEFASKRRSLVQEDDVQFEDIDADPSNRLSSAHLPSKPVNFDLSQPAHNLHNTFNRGLTNIMNERGSLNMFQSGESLMRMSPPSLVSSLMMESSGNFNPESLEGKKSMSSHRDSGIPASNRDSIDPMLTSMTLSILDYKDMNTSFLSQTTVDNGPNSIQYANSHRGSIDPNTTSMTLSILEDKDMRTSFLSQTTYPDNDSMLDSLPPSLVSSVNTSYVSNTSKPKQSIDANIFSSTTFTHIEQTEKLLSARPRCQMFNSIKRDSLRSSESYTKTREEGCQIDATKVLNENADKSKQKPLEMTETVTLTYSNNKFRKTEEKENLNSTFEKNDAFYNDMGLQKVIELGKSSMNVTLDKQELNEIIQARQKLSLARKGLPDSEKLPNQILDNLPIKTIQLPNQTITVPRHSMENASELLSRRRAQNGYDKEEQHREPPKRNATFKKVSPKANSMDATVVFMKDVNNIIDINSATMNLTAEKTLQAEEWSSQERAMVGSSESTDTATFSSSSPPESVPDTVHDTRIQVASTPLLSMKKGAKNDLLNLQSTISPIYDLVNDKSYILKKTESVNSASTQKTYDMHNTTEINSATMVKKSSAKRDILAGKVTPEKKVLGPSEPRMSPQTAVKISPTRTVSYNTMAPPAGVPRKTGLPTSKLLRQYSSHRELRIPGTNNPAVPRVPGKTMTRKGVYSSNPALSPTALRPLNTDSYTVTAHNTVIKQPEEAAPVPKPPALIRQGTETLRRERPQSQLVAPKDHRGLMSGLSQLPRNYHSPPPTTRPYSIAGSSQLRVARPTSVPFNKQANSGALEHRPTSSNTEQRGSALPRPSRLPAPKRSLRPPSVYSVTPASDHDFY